MAEEIYINVSANETRVGVIEQGLLQEVFIERTETRSTVGNIQGQGGSDTAWHAERVC